MAEEDDPETAAGRLEAALDRIARASVQGVVAPASEGAINSAQLAARLDSLIGRLRAEIGGSA